MPEGADIRLLRPGQESEAPISFVVFDVIRSNKNNFANSRSLGLKLGVTKQTMKKVRNLTDTFPG